MLEISRFGIKLPWDPKHNKLVIAGGTILGLAAVGGTVYLCGMLIGRTFNFGSELLITIQKAFDVCTPSIDAVPFSARCGSLELVVFTENEGSKQEMIKLLQSNELSSRIESIVGEPNIKVELTQLGVVIATEEEFAKLKKNMRKKLKAIQQKIDSDFKATMIVSNNIL